MPLETTVSPSELYEILVPIDMLESDKEYMIEVKPMEMSNEIHELKIVRKKRTLTNRSADKNHYHINKRKQIKSK